LLESNITKVLTVSPKDGCGLTVSFPGFWALSYDYSSTADNVLRLLYFLVFETHVGPTVLVLAENPIVALEQSGEGFVIKDELERAG
jgi:hypothetical protein